MAKKARKDLSTQAVSSSKTPGVTETVARRFNPPNREALIVAAILLSAAVVRIIYLIEYKASIPYYSGLVIDSLYYDNWAKRVAAGEGYGPMPFYMAPLYPYVLALIYKLAGHSLGAVYALQAALGIANLGLVYLLGRRLFGFRVGVAAMVVAMLYGPLMFVESKVLTETLSITLNLASIVLFIRAMDEPSAGRYLLTGAVLGLSVICRPVALLMVVLMLAWWHVRARACADARVSVRHMAIMLLGIALMVLPVTARNYFVGRDFVPVSSNGGVTFAYGNNPQATGILSRMQGFTGSIMSQRDEEIALASKALGRPVKASGSSSYWLKQGIGYIVRNPAAYAVLLCRKVMWSLHSYEVPDNYDFYVESRALPILRVLPLPFSLLAGLALFGFVRARRDKASEYASLLGLCALSVFSSLLLFFVIFRYRVPVTPLLAVFAGFGVIGIIDAWRSQKRNSLGWTVACIVPILLVSAVPSRSPAEAAQAQTNLGAGLARQGKLDEAIARYREAVQIDPGYANARFNLANALAKRGDSGEAITQYTEALRIEPNNADAHCNLGNALAEQGRVGEAVEHFTQALKLKPDSMEARYNLGVALMQTGDLKGATDQYREIIRSNPDVAEAHYKLGSVLAKQGRMGEAVASFRTAVRIDPEYARAQVALGYALTSQGEYDGAIRHLSKAAEVKPADAQVHNHLAAAYYLKGMYDKAWEQVNLCRKYGLEPHPGLFKALSAKMLKGG